MNCVPSPGGMTKSPLSSFYFPHFRSSKPNLSIHSFSVFFRTWFSSFILARPPLPWETCFLDAIPYPCSEPPVVMSSSVIHYVTHISINQKKIAAKIPYSQYNRTRLLIRPKNLLWSVSRYRRQQARFCTVPGPRDISRSEFRGRFRASSFGGGTARLRWALCQSAGECPSVNTRFIFFLLFFCVFCSPSWPIFIQQQVLTKVETK